MHYQNISVTNSTQQTSSVENAVSEFGKVEEVEMIDEIINLVRGQWEVQRCINLSPLV